MTSIPSAVLPKSVLAADRHKAAAIRVSPLVVESAAMETAGVYAKLNTRAEGLTDSEAATRLAEYGPNVLAKDQPAGFGKLLWRAMLNPLVILLAVLATISLATGDSPGAAVMASMIALSVALKLIQESKAGNAAAKLKAMISVTATALRGGAPREIAVAQLVPGDVVRLAAGDMIPGDVRIVQAKDLFVVQGSLTGESFPVEKLDVEKKTTGAAPAPIELTSIAFLGTSETRRMDCMDCHNRPAHRFAPPDRAVDLAIALGHIDRALPYIKTNAVYALTRPYKAETEARDGIATFLANRYRDDPRIRQAIPFVQQIYADNFFPAMKANWSVYPDNIGHRNWPGCFRCHDGRHKSEDGKRTIKANDCNACHTILAQGKGAELLQLSADGQKFKHPEDLYDPAFMCTDCHSGGR